MTRLRITLVLLAPALLFALLAAVGPFRADMLSEWAGIGIGHRPGWLPGFPTIDPNIGSTAFALGTRAALDVRDGLLPLWNHYEGLGAPLLGEMQSAALFPPTLLLLLPAGQVLEHALLQAIAGLGAFLFLRRFGLGLAAALAGAVLWEFNGVFAWLRNAVYNPVAFLPWLLYAIEDLYRHERDDAGAGRTQPIAIGALAAALSLYAGFPEVVYFYALLLAAWATLRAVALPPRRALAFAAGLLALGTLALLLAAPVLTAFAAFLREAAVGGHQGTEFRDHVLPPQAFLATLLPYVFGPISAAPQPGAAIIWSDIGGYLGITPLLLAAAGLACSARQPTSWLLACWIVVAVGASHGVPLIHAAFTTLPFTGIAAFARYLDAGWIFAAITLAAIGLERLGSLPPARRPLRLATGVGLATLAVGLAFAWPVLFDLARGEAWQRWFLWLSLSAGAALLAAIPLLGRLRRPTPSLAALAIAEAALLFLVPVASTPHFKGGADWPLISFLRTHAVLQRFAIASGTGLGPNFGSVFRIPSMNYDDLPVPARTARYAVGRLDAATDGVIFGHNAPGAGPAERDANRTRFLAALPGYAAAGVRYVLSADDLATPAEPLAAGPTTPVSLVAGKSVTLDLPRLEAMSGIAGLTVLLGTYGGKSDGVLQATLCQAEMCSRGAASLADAADNRALPIAFTRPLALKGDAPLRLTLAKGGGGHDVAIWMRPAPAEPKLRPILAWIVADTLVPILQTATTTVYELPSYRSYVTAPGCTITPLDHDRMGANCLAPSRLLRLEVFMDGWTARVNGTNTPIEVAEDTFQELPLPAGRSTVAFAFSPPFFPVALSLAAAALSLVLILLLPRRPPRKASDTFTTIRARLRRARRPRQS